MHADLPPDKTRPRVVTAEDEPESKSGLGILGSRRAEQVRSRSRLSDIVATDRRPQLVTLIGGPRGLIETAVPGFAFVGTFAATRSLLWALAVSGGAIVVAGIVRAVRRETLLPVAFGLAGAGVGATFSLITGRAQDMFLPGILAMLGFICVCLISVGVRKPLFGVLVSVLVPGEAGRWEDEKIRRAAYRDVTLIFALASSLRLGVQGALYLQESVVALGLARLAMGIPLYVVCAYAAWLRVRAGHRADKIAASRSRPSGRR